MWLHRPWLGTAESVRIGARAPAAPGPSTNCAENITVDAFIRFLNVWGAQ
jgi:hypothetical protein